MKTLHVACVVLFCLFTINVNAAVYSDVDGSAQNPYQIDSVADWQTLMSISVDWDKPYLNSQSRYDWYHSIDGGQ